MERRACSLHCFSILALLAALVVAGCAPMAPAPVEERSEQRATRQPPPGLPQTVAPANYEVRSGDTLYSIAFRYRLDWRDIAAWNRIGEPYLIRPGQELRLRPPAQVLARRDPAPEARPDERVPPPAPEPEPDPEPASEPAPETRPDTGSAPAESTPAPPARAPAPAASTRRVSGVEWRWPTEGQIVRPFDAAATRRGVGIGGRSGQPVFAAAGGRVVYSGTALIGYGELIIIKHSDTMLSAYAHNRVRLVEEGVEVRSGQQIAEMGVSDRNEELLHFEIRRNGQPENPLDFLPPR
ncbi:MAG: LysM peptidoglycan-binding domain-containing protein [Wenzhouxiangella sp.]|nr:MAG: LysM peptidoglycan-binding domain-containing protein [Wenzhouxiangella sp.]